MGRTATEAVTVGMVYGGLISEAEYGVMGHAPLIVVLGYVPSGVFHTTVEIKAKDQAR